MVVVVVVGGGGDHAEDVLQVSMLIAYGTAPAQSLAVNSLSSTQRSEL